MKAAINDGASPERETARHRRYPYISHFRHNRSSPYSFSIQENRGRVNPPYFTYSTQPLPPLEISQILPLTGDMVVLVSKAIVRQPLNNATRS
jgi:hypothetical protein